MKILKLIILTIIFTVSVHSQWLQQTSGVTTELRMILSVNENLIIASGEDGLILRSTNGGNNWSTVASGTNIHLPDIYFVNDNTGFATGQGIFIKTVNGGASWQTVSTPTGIGRMHFINATTGWRACNNDKIGKTINGGQNWNYYEIGIDNSFSKEPYFFNTSLGYLLATAVDSTYVLKTNNGGENWSVIHRSKNPASNMMVANLNRIYICGGNGLFLKTTDSGANWLKDTIVTGGQAFYDLHFSDVNTGIAVGSGGRVFVTLDGGSNWVQEASSTTSTLLDVYFDEGTISTGYAVGIGGTIIKTTNGGALGITQLGTETPEKFILGQNYPNPFNPVTNINFSVPKTGNVKLVVFDATGREVAELVNRQLTAGTYKAEFDASYLSSGVYFYKLVTFEFTEVKKMMLVK